MSSRRNVLLSGLALSMVGTTGHAEESPVIAAAADLQGPMPEIVAAFKAQTGKTVTVTYGFTVGSGALYATGRIGLFVPKGSRVKGSADLRDLAPALRDGRLRKFAIANPQHAPYGVAAKEALTKAGVWWAIEPHLVLGENAAQATVFALSGATEAAIIPYSLALKPDVRAAGDFTLISDSWHNPLRQRAVVLKGATAVARDFFAYLQTPAARTVFKRYGFILPGERR
jgi:molybdate transport system substrate-binding protein